MKTRSVFRRSRLALFLLLGLAVCGFSVAGIARAETPTVRLVFEPTPNPPRFLGEGGAIDWEKPGITLELLREVGRRLGVRFTYKRVPWKRGLFMVEHGQADGIFHASFKKQRQRIGVFPMRAGKPDPRRSIFTQRYVFYRLKDAPFAWDGKSLRNLEGPVGVLRGYSIQGDLEKKGVPISISNGQEQILGKLRKGRVGAFANLEGMTDAFLADQGDLFDDVVKVAPAIKSKPYYLMFSHGFYRQHRDLAERIWQTAVEINDSPAFQAILRKYQ